MVISNIVAIGNQTKPQIKLADRTKKARLQNKLQLGFLFYLKDKSLLFFFRTKIGMFEFVQRVFHFINKN